MHRFHLTRNLRSLAFLLILAAILTGTGLIIWANSTGLPETWRTCIEKEVSKKGAHVKIGSLRFMLLRGVVATDVRVFQDPEHLHEISQLERVTVDFDKTKLARGVFDLNKLELNHARLAIPADPSNPFTETLHITDASGTIYFPGNRRLELRNARGKIAGIDITLNARIIPNFQEPTEPKDEQKAGARRALLAKIIKELSQWQFSKKSPPNLNITLEGDANDSSTLNAKISLKIKDMAKNSHRIDLITAEAEMLGHLLTVKSLHAADARGTLHSHMDYDFHHRNGRFDISSSLEIPALLQSWLGLPALKDVTITGKQFLEAGGTFQLDKQHTPHFRLTGHARCESIRLKTMPFASIEGSFAWQDGRAFIRDLKLLRGDGQAEGKIMVEWPKCRLQLHTTLPVPVYRPFFVGQPLEKVLAEFNEQKGATVDVSLDGSFNAHDKTAWNYIGNGTIQNHSYKGVPVDFASCKMELNHSKLDFSQGTVVFNYEKYPLRNTFNGPNTATAKIGRIRYDAPSKTIAVDDISGNFWASPMTRFFAPKIADTLEQYRFHTPPKLAANGLIDVTPQGRTKLDISFSSETPADYTFLGENITLTQPSGKVSIRGEKVTVASLKLGAFGGSIAGSLAYLGNGRLTGDVSWTNLTLQGLASTYHFEINDGGTATGRLDFALNNGDLKTMTGNGLLALQKAELFSVPMFGPLSPLIGGILNDETAGKQRAKSAFLTYKIRNGILHSDDFHTQTTSLNFTGEGIIDLNERSFDMTVRMNTRGFLGFITLPLFPFSGLFQFRGSGPFKTPHWENMKFSLPNGTQKEILLSPPKAKIISEGQ